MKKPILYTLTLVAVVVIICVLANTSEANTAERTKQEQEKTKQSMEQTKQKQEETKRILAKRIQSRKWFLLKSFQNN